MKLRLQISFLISIFIFLVGCTHSLEIKNLNQYQTSSLNTLSRELSMGVMTTNSHNDGQLLVTGTAQALSNYIGNIRYPYSAASSERVDIISKISVSSDHKGSGYNFFINFPGFLVWAPAWNGYIYEPSYNVDIKMLMSHDNSLIDSFTIPVKLDVRHASITRTWTEVTWLEFGVIGFVGGLVFMRYDDDVTRLVEEVIQKPIGDFIAQEIAVRLRNSKKYQELLKLRKIQPAQ